MTIRLRRLRLVNAALLASVLSTPGCSGSDDSGEAATPAVGVRTALAVARPFTETIGAIGAVAARVGGVASLSAPGPTRIVRVNVSVGEHVGRGQTLIQLDEAAFVAASQSADAALQTAQQANERAQRLATQGIIPRKDAEQAAAELAKAKAEAVAARRTRDLAVLHSPIDGVVTRINAALGASVNETQPLVEIADPSALDIIASVTPGEAARIRTGATVTIAAGQSGEGERLGSGRVADVAGTVDSATRSVAVRIELPAARRPLRIGETVFARIAIAVRPNAIAIPAEALVPEGEGFKVFVVDAAGIAHERHVTVGARADSLAEITGGLSAGERVVTYGAYGVDDSVKVVPLETGTP
jgi:RND family efflux transporter MFP subunit